MKKLTALFMAILMVLSLAACAFMPQQTETTDENMKKFTVTVVHADGTSKDFTYETKETYVGPVITEAGLIKGEEGPYGLMITEVDGEVIEDTNKAYWAVYEGEEYAMQGIDTTPVVDGAVYKLVYTLV